MEVEVEVEVEDEDLWVLRHALIVGDEPTRA